MDIKKIEYVVDYFDSHYEDDFVYVIIHALFNCLTEEEITFLYFNSDRGGRSLKKTIESYIVKRTTNEPKRAFDKIAKTLLRKLPEQSYKERLTARTFLSTFIQSLPKSTIRTFFDLFIHSERKYDRQKANSVVHLIWDDEVEGYLRSNLKKYKDEESLIPLIINLKGTDLCNLVRDVWKKDFPRPRIKKLIAKQLENESLDKVKFLDKVDPSYYIQILNSKGRKIEIPTIKRLIKNMNEQNRNYIIWCLGLTGDWDLVTKHIKSRV